MNQTVDILSIPAICETCQISHGFSSADQRYIIVMVVLVVIALVLCYAGVLWYAIRTRFIPDDKTLIMLEDVHTNQAYVNEEQGGNIEANVHANQAYVNEVQGGNMVNVTATTIQQPAILMVEDDKERF